MGEMTDRAEQMGRQAHQSDWLDYAIRAGLVAYGVVHLLVGWLALQLAFGESEGTRVPLRVALAVRTVPWRKMTRSTAG